MDKLIIDKLYERVEERGVVCLGLDTDASYIPQHILEGKSLDEAIFQFNKEIIDATLDVVACYKVQIAYYEALGLAGLIAYRNTLKYLREKDAIIIGVGTRIEIWNREKWKSYNSDENISADEIAENMTMLGI